MNKYSLKIVTIGFLGIILLIPIFLIWVVNEDRRIRKKQVVRNLAQVWKASRIVGGPALLTGDRHLAPGLLTVKGDARVRPRNRGIYRVPFYAADLTLEGKIHLSTYSLKKGTLLLYLNEAEPHEVDSARLGGKPLYFRNSSKSWILEAAPPKNLRAGTHSFTIRLKFNGIERLRFLPVAVRNRLSLSSNWKDPSFRGFALPVKRSLHQKGFQADWTVRRGKVSVSRFFRMSPGNLAYAEKKGPGFTYGAEFFQPANIYLKMERALKYAALFIALTFLGFFLSEVLQGARLHPVQYLFVGFALSVFYLLLLSLAEHIGFRAAYGLAASSTCGLLGVYGLKIMKRSTHAITTSAALMGLYIFLYIILSLEDYSLLAGSVLLFLVLAGSMFATRNIQWYGEEPAEKAA